MDFKVAGTQEFVTALQLDTKLDGIPASVLAAALTQAQRRPPGDPRRDGRGDRRAPRRCRPYAPRDHHDQDPGRQDRRGHRPEGQDDQPDPGRHRRRDLHRGRRHDLHRCHQRRVGRGRARGGQRDRQPDDARGRRALPRHGRQDDRPSARSSRCCPARTACCTSRSSASSPAASASRTSRTSSPSARRSRSRSPRSTTAASCRWSRSWPTARARRRPTGARRPPRRRGRPASDGRTPEQRRAGDARRAAVPASRGTPGCRAPDVAGEADGAVVRRTVLPGGAAGHHRGHARPCARRRSACWVGVGSRDEAPATHGARTSSSTCSSRAPRGASALDISAALDAVGGEFNAFTGKEYTCYYARVLDEDLPLAVDVLGDMVTSSLIDAEDVEAERDVILEEIAMHDDDPARRRARALRRGRAGRRTRWAGRSAAPPSRSTRVGRDDDRRATTASTTARGTGRHRRRQRRPRRRRATASAGTWSARAGRCTDGAVPLPRRELAQGPGPGARRRARRPAPHRAGQRRRSASSG